MDVRMVLQGLAPGVENHGYAELRAEMPGIGGDGGKCLGRCAEQDRTALRYDCCVAGDRLRTVMFSIIRRRRGLISAIGKPPV